jgi:hypothetical protein
VVCAALSTRSRYGLDTVGDDPKVLSRRPFARARNFPLGTAFKTALHLAAKSDSSHVSAFLPGTSDVALSIAVDHGMRITFPMVLVSTHDFGNWAQYLPRNPGFM